MTQFEQRHFDEYVKCKFLKDEIVQMMNAGKIESKNLVSILLNHSEKDVLRTIIAKFA